MPRTGRSRTASVDTQAIDSEGADAEGAFVTVAAVRRPPREGDKENESTLARALASLPTALSGNAQLHEIRPQSLVGSRLTLVSKPAEAEAKGWPEGCKAVVLHRLAYSDVQPLDAAEIVVDFGPAESEMRDLDHDLDAPLQPLQRSYATLPYEILERHVQISRSRAAVLGASNIEDALQRLQLDPRFICAPEFVSAPWLFTSPFSAFSVTDGRRASRWREAAAARGELEMIGLFLATRERGRPSAEVARSGLPVHVYAGMREQPLIHRWGVGMQRRDGAIYALVARRLPCADDAIVFVPDLNCHPQVWPALRELLTGNQCGEGQYPHRFSVHGQPWLRIAHRERFGSHEHYALSNTIPGLKESVAEAQKLRDDAGHPVPGGVVRPLVVDIAVARALSAVMFAREDIAHGQCPDVPPCALWEWFRAGSLAKQRGFGMRSPLSVMDVDASPELERLVRATACCATCGCVTFATPLHLGRCQLEFDALCVLKQQPYTNIGDTTTGPGSAFAFTAVCSCAACGAAFCCPECLRRHGATHGHCPPVCPEHVSNWREDLLPQRIVLEEKAAALKRTKQNQKKRAQRRAKKQQQGPAQEPPPPPPPFPETAATVPAVSAELVSSDAEVGAAVDAVVVRMAEADVLLRAARAREHALLNKTVMERIAALGSAAEAVGPEEREQFQQDYELRCQANHGEGVGQRQITERQVDDAVDACLMACSAQRASRRQLRRRTADFLDSFPRPPLTSAAPIPPPPPPPPPRTVATDTVRSLAGVLECRQCAETQSALRLTVAAN